LSVITSLAVSAPVAAGLNATSIVQTAAGVSVGPQVFNSRNEVGSVPVSAIPVISSVVVPLLVTVTLCAADVVPLAVDANVRLALLRVTEGFATPVPVSVAICGVPGAVSETLSVAFSAPAEAGLNATKTVQLAPPASDVPQVLIPQTTWDWFRQG
jgi:hypothetical protein